MIEQAIFTSARTEHGDGYQLAACSEGISDADARQLALWGPSHDALLDASPLGRSVNYFVLPSGARCISRTINAGTEYSNRGGSRIYTHFLVMPDEVFGRYGNNPFSIVRAAMAGGALDVPEELPRKLAPLRLPGGAAVFDRPLVERLVGGWGADRFAGILATAIIAPSLGWSACNETEQTVAGVLACLPPACRKEISLTTGLRHSPRRPFRWMAFHYEDGERRRLQRKSEIEFIDLTSHDPFEPARIDGGWAGFVAACLREGDYERLSHGLQDTPAELSLDDLNALGDELLRHARQIPSSKGGSNGSANGSQWRTAPPQRSTSCEASASSRRYHAATSKSEGPAARLKPLAPNAAARLEALDQAVYDAFAGDDDALKRLGALWSSVAVELGIDRQEQLHEQYLRYVLRLWDATRSGSTADPRRAVAALEVIGIITAEQSIAPGPSTGP